MLLYAALSLAAAALMISNASIWIDEGQTLHFAGQPTFSAWWETLRTNVKSEAQMPLGMFLAWVGVQIIGDGEWQLRAMNFLWVALAGVAMGLIGRQTQNRFVLALLLLHPFLWYYANEARPYALQIAAGAWLLFLLLRWQKSCEIHPGEACLFLVAAVIGYGSSLLFAFPLFGFFVTLALLWRRRQPRFRLHGTALVPLVLALMLLGALTVYFLETLQRGASGAKIWNVQAGNLVFALYEMLGFSGFGPPRHELRDLARSPGLLLPTHLQPRLLLGVGGLSLILAALVGRLWQRRHDPLIRLTAAFVVFTTGALLAGATFMRFPFWGRHLSALLPAFALLLAQAAAPAPGLTGWRRYALPAWLLLALTISSLVIRFDERYAKDDYRSASQLALRALDAGRTVWWSADDEECAQYYQLHAAKTSVGERLAFARKPDAAELAVLPRPDVIFLSKPDFHDVHGTVSSYITTHGYREIKRLPAFVIWTRPGGGLESIFDRAR